MSLRDRDRHIAGDGLGLALHLGREVERPVAAHPRLQFQLVQIRVVRPHELRRRRHAGHPVRAHVKTDLEDDGSGYGLAVGNMDETDFDDCHLAGFDRWPGGFEAVILSSGDRCRGYESGGYCARKDGSARGGTSE
jgi:hypothetical protein